MATAARYPPGVPRLVSPLANWLVRTARGKPKKDDGNRPDTHLATMAGTTVDLL